MGDHPRTALSSQNKPPTRLHLARKTATPPTTPSPPLPSLPTSTQTLTRRQRGRRSHRYGTSRVKFRGCQPIRRLRTTRRRNSSLNSTTQRAPITAGAAAAKAKRAIDPAATVIVTSTPAGASKVRRDPWASPVQAKVTGVQTSVWFLAAFPQGYLLYAWHCLIGLPPDWHLASWRVPPPPSRPYLLPPLSFFDREFGIPHVAGGRSPFFFFLLFTIGQHWTWAF